VVGDLRSTAAPSGLTKLLPFPPGRGQADGVESSARLPSGGSPRLGVVGVQDSYLVDSASSHMLVSKIKPCMSKYKHLYRETANGSLNQL
jgi:hypothetical protein